MDISKTEYEVMCAVWQDAPCSANDVIERLRADGAEWHEKTVKTLLGRLVKKQALGFEKQGRHYVYNPLIGQEAYQRRESESFIQRMFGGRVSPLVASFAKQEKLTEKDVQELKSLIDQWEKKND